MEDDKQEGVKGVLRWLRPPHKAVSHRRLYFPARFGSIAAGMEKYQRAAYHRF
jgi:hypothetical protein